MRGPFFQESFFTTGTFFPEFFSSDHFSGIPFKGFVIMNTHFLHITETFRYYIRLGVCKNYHPSTVNIILLAK